MSSLLYAALIFVHLACAIIWLGGMVFAHFALRPAAVKVLDPPSRLPLLAESLGRFFRLVAAAVLGILLSGWLLLSRVGLAASPVGWHVMLALGVVMALNFAFIYARPFPMLRTAVAARQWQPAADALNRIRILVLINLCLGFVAVASASLARS